jgi:hypothetical protein
MDHESYFESNVAPAMRAAGASEDIIEQARKGARSMTDRPPRATPATRSDPAGSPLASFLLVACVIGAVVLLVTRVGC